MGFFEDWGGYRKRWQSASLTEKIFLCALLFGTTSSLTSLAENVFKWRGFIQDGVEFYQSVIRAKFIDIFGFINFHFTATEADILILSNIMLTSISKVASKDLEKAVEGSEDKKAAHMVVIAAAVYSIVLLILLSREKEYRNWVYILIVSVFLLRMIMSTFQLDVRSEFMSLRERFIAVWGTVIFATALVLILAAINTGLTKPLP